MQKAAVSVGRVGLRCKINETGRAQRRKERAWRLARVVAQQMPAAHGKPHLAHIAEPISPMAPWALTEERGYFAPSCLALGRAPV